MHRTDPFQTTLPLTQPHPFSILSLFALFFYLPYFNRLYFQSAHLDIGLKKQSLQGQTTLWLYFKQGVKAGDKFRIHCRQCQIQEVSINGKHKATYQHKDGLHRLFTIPKKRENSGGNLDKLYRAALEIAREGELEIVVPELSEHKYEDIRDIPKDDTHPDVIKTYRAIKSWFQQYGAVSRKYDVEGDEGKAASNPAEVKFIQLKIKYSLGQNNMEVSGINFRKQSPFVKVFDQRTFHHDVYNDQSHQESVACCYTASFNQSLLRDVDGVRTWLPCIDTLDQHGIFDISLTVRAKFHVMCCGKKVSMVLRESPKDNKKYVTHRFLTTTHVPAMQLGFFIGNVESYAMRWQQTIGNIWVVNDLADFKSISMKENLHKAEDASAEKGLEPHAKRLKTEHHSSSKGSNGHHEAVHVKKEKETQPQVQAYRKLYEDKVSHTMHGFDLVFNLIQKFTGHKFNYDNFTVIFIHELGQDAVTYDGFMLIDAKFLHTHTESYLETASNVLLLTSFLYSWFKSSVWIDSYENEFIIHGLVQYLVSFYIDEVFGEDEGKYHVQKMLDIVLSLEKQGRGFPLAAFYPERYEIFSGHFVEYLKAKSLLLMNLLENRVGGRDSMRMALKRMIRSPFLYKSKSGNGSERRGGDNSDSFSPTGSQSPASLSSGSPHIAMYQDIVSPRYAGDASPMPYEGSMFMTVDNRVTSPNSDEVVVPYTPYRHDASPITNNGFQYQTADISPSHIMSPEWSLAASNAKGDSSTVEMLSAEVFLNVIRKVSGSLVDITDDILNRYVYDTGMLYLKIDVTVSEKQGANPRTIFVSTEQIGYKAGGELAPKHCKRGQFVALMIEERDSYVTRPVCTFSNKKETKDQIQYVRPGRTGQKLGEFPVHQIYLDPSMHWIGEYRNTSQDMILINQLRSDYNVKGDAIYKLRTYYQCQAIRSLAKSVHIVTVEHNQRFPASVKSFYDCLLDEMTYSEINTTEKNAVRAETSIFIKAEAAYGMASWQNEHAPRELHPSPTPNESWYGMNALIECIYQLYINEDTKKPDPYDFENENSCYLRNSLLTALSTIRSRDGYTPWEVVEILLSFAEALDEDQLDDANNEMTGNSNNSQYDATYCKAVLLLALSRIRFAHLNIANPEHNIFKVVQYAKKTISNAHTQARSTSRINYKVGDANLLPCLPGHGIHVAAALTCLAEVDIQVVQHILASPQNANLKVKRIIELKMLTPASIFTETRYQDYYLPPNTSLNLIILAAGEDKAKAKSMRKDFDFFLCNSLIRAAAFEAFSRVACCVHLAHESLRKQKSENEQERVRIGMQGSSSSKKDEEGPKMLAAVVESMETMLKKESSTWLKQQCVQIFSEAVFEQPFRVVTEALSLGYTLNTYGCSDPKGLTIAHRPGFASYEQIREGLYRTTFVNPKVKVAFAAKDTVNLIALDTILTLIQRSSYQQIIRSTLLKTWIYMFGTKVPTVFAQVHDGRLVLPESYYKDLVAALGIDRSDMTAVRNPLKTSIIFDEVIQRNLFFP